MTRRRFFDLCEGDRIKVYSAGRYEGEGIFIRFTEEKHEDFIYWIKRNGNDCYTSLDAINIEKVRYGMAIVMVVMMIVIMTVANGNMIDVYVIRTTMIVIIIVAIVKANVNVIEEKGDDPILETKIIEKSLAIL
ncbi:hypothetical protein bthur0012_59970 [Bacillus thuringiensis serovar pulsiensis BGSC 4CC1]|nr:hypothetical protein bthur0012_59970 [Bacillus thuringiensis serovar pulsiensis BGSC 4CC1]